MIPSRAYGRGECRPHRGRHDGDHLSGLSAEHGEAEDRVVVRVDDGFHEAPCLGQLSGARHGGHWQGRDTNGDAALMRLRLAQAGTAGLRFDETRHPAERWARAQRDRKTERYWTWFACMLTMMSHEVTAVSHRLRHAGPSAQKRYGSNACPTS